MKTINKPKDYYYKGHLFKFIDDQCPFCNRHLKQMDGFPMIWCDCGQYSKKLDGKILINGNQYQFDFEEVIL